MPLEALRPFVVEACDCLQGPLIINVGSVSVVEAIKMPVEGCKGASKGRESTHRDCRVGGFNFILFLEFQ